MSPPITYLMTVLASLLILEELGAPWVHGFENSPDFGLCKTMENNAPTSVDCLQGRENFCCYADKIKGPDNSTYWTRKCCSELEFVAQNSGLYTVLVFATVSMINLMLVVIITSMSSMILTKKIAME